MLVKIVAVIDKDFEEIVIYFIKLIIVDFNKLIDLINLNVIL